MKMKKNALAGTIAAGLIAGGTLGLSAPAVSAPGLNLDAGVEISNMYLYRGEDLGDGGLALVAGWLEASHDSGVYIGTWAASGDGDGTEVDLYAGYGLDITEEVSVDLNVTTFMFPKQARGDEDFVDFGDFSEVGLGISAYGAEFAYYNNIAGDSGYQYYSLGYGFGPFSATIGVNDFDEAADGPYGEDFTHLDLSYAYNDNLSFTASTIVDADIEDDLRKSTLLEVMYTVNF